MTAALDADELPPLSALPAQEFPVVRRVAPPSPLAARGRVSELSVLMATILATLTTGVSVGMTLAGQPSTTAIVIAAVLTVLLVWTVLPLVFSPRRVR